MKPAPNNMPIGGDKAKRRAIWSSLNGCNCPVTALRGERCTVMWVRCSGRLARIYRRLAALVVKSRRS